jgi:hypothetical protein
LRSATQIENPEEVDDDINNYVFGEEATSEVAPEDHKTNRVG